MRLNWIGLVLLPFFCSTLESYSQTHTESVIVSKMNRSATDLVLHFSLNGRNDSLSVPWEAIVHMVQSKPRSEVTEPDNHSPEIPRFIRFQHTSASNGELYSVRAELGKMAVFKNESTNVEVMLPTDLVAITGSSYRAILYPEKRNAALIGVDSGTFVFDVQHSIPIIVGISVILLGLAALALGIIFRFRRRHQRTIESRRILFKVREEERSEIASDLHDGPIQALQLIQNMSSGNQERTRELALMAAEQIRTLCAELKPPILHHFGFVKAAQSYVSDLKPLLPGVEFHLKIDQENVKLTPDEDLLFYKVLIESLANISKHANAKNIWITASGGLDSQVLEIRDDGIGFQLPSNFGMLEQKGHFGLSFLFQRVESMGGSLNLYSKKSQGTRVVLKVEKKKEFPMFFNFKRSA